MNEQQAKDLIKDTFEFPFQEDKFARFAKNLLNEIDDSEEKKFKLSGSYIQKAFRDHVSLYQRLGTYTTPEGEKLDVLIVKLKTDSKLEQARTMQRNFVAQYLKSRDEKNAALVAYYSEDSENWRFSYVKMEYELAFSEQGIRAAEKLTPARRFSFLVGKGEPNHTAQQQLLPILRDISHNPSLEQLEQAFNIESVTKEFFERYKELFLTLKEELDRILDKSPQIKKEFSEKGIETVNFAKKLLGQIVFLYFLQKKGWLGVDKDGEWGSGDRDFLSNQFSKVGNKNYFQDVLEPLFYEALAIERPNNYYDRLNCKIPFLNGGLFEPMNGYDWEHDNLPINNKTFAKILDTFNLYNFTVREDEPLEKEVAVDPEMLGKVFENLLEIRDRKSKGAYYTPREIVHYMCQESLINYLDTAVNRQERGLVPDKPEQAGMFSPPPPKQKTLKVEQYTPIIPREDIEQFIHLGELAQEHEQVVAENERETRDYAHIIPESIRENAELLDAALADVKVCDPAVGSGAFPVGMMHEIVRARNALTPHLANNSQRTAYRFKWHCIENSLYGVDIDSGAIEIAKLRLWLSLVVDEDRYDNIRPLPNLDYRIVCGNSLLNYPYERRGLETLELLKEQYFKEIERDKKEKLKQRINKELTDLYRNTPDSLGYQVTVDFRINFSEVFRSKGGFDIVIANPPYIKEYTNRSAFDGLRSSPYYMGKMDIWYFFTSVGLDILKDRTYAESIE